MPRAFPRCCLWEAYGKRAVQVSGSLIVSSVAFGTYPALYVSPTKGRVGVGTIAPTAPLEVSGTISATAVIAGTMQLTTLPRAKRNVLPIAGARAWKRYRGTLKVQGPQVPRDPSRLLRATALVQGGNLLINGVATASARRGRLIAGSGEEGEQIGKPSASAVLIDQAGD